MNPHRPAARAAGILFLIALIFTMIASAVYQPIVNATDDLAIIDPNRNRVAVGVLLDFACAPAMILIPIVLFPVFRRFSEVLARGYVAFRLLEGVLYTFLAIDVLSLLNLSRSYLAGGAANPAAFQVVGASIHARIEWTNAVYLLVYGIGAVLFYKLLFTSRLIPRWLSGWGLLAALLMPLGALLHLFQVFGAVPLMKVMPWFAPPIALQELVMAIWFIVKGFDTARLAIPDRLTQG